MDTLCYFFGSLLVIAAAVDIFLTIFYARSGISLFSTYVNKTIWFLFRYVAKFFYARKDIILSFCGPLLMVFLLFTWTLLLITGFALIVWPQLGSSITASQGATDTGFWNAFFYSGYNFTTLGIGNLTPQTDLMRVLTVLQSAMGFSFFTMTITYFLSVYNALRTRNTFALNLHYKTGGSADASDYLCDLKHDNRAQEISRDFSQIAAEVAEILEAHHLYPILHYFRYKENQLALPRFLGICLDAVSLSKSLFKEEFCIGFKHTAAANQLWISSMNLTSDLSNIFLSHKLLNQIEINEHVNSSLWRQRFLTAFKNIHQDPAVQDSILEAAAQEYIELRKQWNRHIMAFCNSQLYEYVEIMPFEQEITTS